jgi:hypothetical protein
VRLLVIERTADRTRRVYVLGRRVHHGLAGAVTAVTGLVVGLGLMWDDLEDFPWPLERRRRA